MTYFHSFVVNEVEHLFICLWGNCVSSSVLFLFVSFALFFFHFLINSYSSLYILNISPVSFKCVAEIIPSV